MDYARAMKDHSEARDKAMVLVELIFSDQPALTGGAVEAAEVFLNGNTYGFIYPGDTVRLRVAPWRFWRRRPVELRVVAVHRNHTPDESYAPIEVSRRFVSGQMYRRRLHFEVARTADQPRS